MAAQMQEITGEHEALIQFLYLAPVGLAQTTADGEILMMNPICAQLLMPLARNGELTNFLGTLQHIAPDLRHLIASFARPSGMICEAQRIHVTAGNGRSDAQVLALSMVKLDEQRLMMVLNDVTQQVKRERLLRQNEAWLNAIVTGASEYALVSLDRDGRVNDWNESIGRLTGFDRQAVVGQLYSIFYPPDGTTADRVRDRLREADDGGWSLDDGWRRRADGSRFWGIAMLSPVRLPEDSDAGVASLPGAGETAYCLVIRDISDKREASEKIRRATTCDHLTGLANRRTFIEAAEVERGRRRRAQLDLTLVMFDADHFKSINDRFGHPAGDSVLRHMAGILAANFRECDIVARLGGEEFAVLLPSMGLADASAAAARVLEAIEAQPVLVDGVPISYTVSGGISVMEPDVADLDTLIKRADEALYAAKRAGRNQIVVWSPRAA